MLNRTNIVLAVLLAVVMALTGLVRVDTSRPNLEIMPDMKYSPAWTAYQPNPHLPDGRTLQPPPPGTIPRGEMPLHYQATPQDALRAGVELLNPYWQDEDSQRLPASIQRGEKHFRAVCHTCHGAGGLGDGPVAQRGFPPPPSLLTGASRQMADGQLFHILTYGQGNMAPMATQLTAAQRWDVINYIRQMQQQTAETEPNDVD